MTYRLAALMLASLGLALGFSVVFASGANTLGKPGLGVSIPTLAGLVFAIAWWRKADRRNW